MLMKECFWAAQAFLVDCIRTAAPPVPLRKSLLFTLFSFWLGGGVEPSKGHWAGGGEGSVGCRGGPTCMPSGPPKPEQKYAFIHPVFKEERKAGGAPARLGRPPGPKPWGERPWRGVSVPAPLDLRAQGQPPHWRDQVTLRWAEGGDLGCPRECSER